MLARPDPNTFELLPWTSASDGENSARMFCDIDNLDGAPFAGDPRYVLRRNLERARELGYTFYGRPRDGVLLLPRRRPARRPSPSTPAATST